VAAHIQGHCSHIMGRRIAGIAFQVGNTVSHYSSIVHLDNKAFARALALKPFLVEVDLDIFGSIHIVIIDIA